MTGDRSRPEQLREKITQLIRYELQGLPTASLGRIKSLDEDTRRATIETVPDGTTETNVPVAAPFATDGAGDFAPLNPEVTDSPVRGVVLYLHHPLEPQLGADSYQYDGQREADEENAIFLPAMLWFDTDTVPDHDPGERRIQNANGNAVRMDDETAGVEHTLGAFARTAGNPEPEYDESPFDEGFKAERDEDEDFREFDEPVETEPVDAERTDWPEGKDGESWFEAGHTPAGRDLTITRRGAAFEADRGQEMAVGALNDGERKPLSGPHQHFHPIYHGDGSVSLAGPPLSFREFIAWMTDPEKRRKLRNPDAYGAPRQYAQNYLEWLEAETGEAIDPSNPSDWPDPQPMPDPEENWLLSPPDRFVIVHQTVSLPEAEAHADGLVPTITTTIN